MNEKLFDQIKNRKESESVSEMCRRLGVTVPSYYRWQRKQKGWEHSGTGRRKLPKNLGAKAINKPVVLTEFVLPKEPKGFLFVGSPEFLAGIVNNLQ